MKEIVSTDKAPEAIGPYSQGVKMNGMLFTSGQIPIDPKTGHIAKGGIKMQAEQSMRNVKAVLEAGGYTMNDIIKVSILLTDIEDFSVVNEVYQSYFDGDYPARSCYAVKALPKDVGIEIEAIAGK